MLDPSFVPESTGEPGRFGAKDVTDLTWKNLMEAYTLHGMWQVYFGLPGKYNKALLSPRKNFGDGYP